MHLSESGRVGSPEIYYIGIKPLDGRPVLLRDKDVAENAQIRDEFHPVSGKVQEIPAFLRVGIRRAIVNSPHTKNTQACIMLHGKILANESSNFSESFLKSLRHACRRCREDSQGQTDASCTAGRRESATGYASSPEMPLALESSMRKTPRTSYPMTESGNRGPYPPRFDALHSQSSPVPAFGAGPVSQARSQLYYTAYGNGFTNIDRASKYGHQIAYQIILDPNAEEVDINDTNTNMGQTPVAPRAMIHIWSKVCRHCSLDSDQY